MRKLLGVFLALGLMLSGAFSAVAQDNGTSLGEIGGSPATWTDSRGTALATLEVTEIVADWDDHDERYAPERGYAFHAVNFTVTNIDSDTLTVGSRDFSLVDTEGANNSRANARLAEDATTVLLEEDTDVAAGESAEFTLVYQLFSDASPAMFVWQPESGKIVLVDVSEGDVEGSAIAHGLNTPATWTDERGNDVATFEVLEVTQDWQDYGQYSTPDRGSGYVAIHFQVTNVSDSAIEIVPYNFSMLDSESSNTGRSYMSETTGEVQLFSDDVMLEAGESYDGLLVFSVFSGVQPVALVWQAEFGMLNIVVLAEGEATPATDATPEADADDADGRPAGVDVDRITDDGDELDEGTPES